jgi:hypothetical protein
MRTSLREYAERGNAPCYSRVSVTIRFDDVESRDDAALPGMVASGDLTRAW